MRLAKLGRTLSAERRANIGLSQIGRISPMKGKRHSEKTKRKMSEQRKGDARCATYGMLGKHHSETTKRKMSKAQSGLKHYLFGKHHTDEWKKKTSLSLNKWYSTHSGSWLGKKRSQKFKKFISKLHTGKKRSKETCRNISKAVTLWANQDKVKNNLREHAIRRLGHGGFGQSHPNGFEGKFIKAFAKFKLPYQYVGNGKFWVENMNPDFVNVNGKKEVVELFGCYWHGCPKCHPNKEVEQQKDAEFRTKAFAKYGIQSKIIWEHELKSRTAEEIISKLFITGGNTK
jgi:hypothetical protein